MSRLPKDLSALVLALLMSACVMSSDGAQGPPPQASDPWYAVGESELELRLSYSPITGQAKNVILFVGDGMGLSTVTAARIFDGQSRGDSGEENYLSFDRMPHVALVKTYNSNSQVPDSAATAGAMNTGVKMPIGAVNIYADQSRADCVGDGSTFPETLAQQAESRGMSTGVVTTVRLTHATPSAVYAHVPDREWEYNATLPQFARLKGCKDIATQFVDFPYGDGIDVALGGGRRSFVPEFMNGLRDHGENLIEKWQAKYSEGVYIESAHQLRNLDSTITSRVLGLFALSEMAFEAERDETAEPSLTEMTETAIKILSNNDNGFYLMVEGGRIDRAHHWTRPYNALSETQEFAKAVGRALEMVDLSETLVLVTADHSHTMVITGYPHRGSPILGLPWRADMATGEIHRKPMTSVDGKPFATIGYFTGPNPRSAREDSLSDEEVQDPQYVAESAVQIPNATHNGEDVALYGIGAGSWLVSGVMEQNTIYHIMTHALGWRTGAETMR